MTPPSEDLVDDALRQIGLIAIGAAALEMNLARLASIGAKDLSLDQALRLSNKKKLASVREVLSQRRNFTVTERTDANRRRRAIAWAEQAVDLLRQRGDLMHSEWIVARQVADRRAPKELLSQHLSTRHRTPVDPSALAELASTIDDHNRKYGRIWSVGFEVHLSLTSEEWDRLTGGRLK